MAMPSRGMFWTGFVLAGLGAVLFSAKAIVAKLLYLHGVDALDVIGFRMLLALPFFVCIALVQMSRARRGLLARLDRRDGLRIAVLGFIGYYLSSFLDFMGLQYISAGLERLILFLSPTFVLLFSRLVPAQAHRCAPVAGHGPGLRRGGAWCSGPTCRSRART